MKVLKFGFWLIYFSVVKLFSPACWFHYPFYQVRCRSVAGCHDLQQVSRTDLTSYSEISVTKFYLETRFDMLLEVLLNYNI